MINDTSLIRMVIDSLVKQHDWSYEYALEKFYNSRVCKGISDKNTGMFTFSPNEIVRLCYEEFSGII